MRSAPVPLTDVQAYQTSLELLAEVADYLARLPVTPTTRALENRVRAHLRDPSAVAAQRRAAVLAEDAAWAARIAAGACFVGVAGFTTDGAPTVDVEILFPSLRITSPACAALRTASQDKEADELASAIGRQIEAGLNILLRPSALPHDA